MSSVIWPADPRRTAETSTALSGGEHDVWHHPVGLHTGSEQSAPRAQSSSMPLPQISVVATAQSRGQFAQLSAPSHTRSPQQYVVGTVGVLAQVSPFEEHRESEHATGVSPSPSPQQNRAVGFPP